MTPLLPFPIVALLAAGPAAAAPEPVGAAQAEVALRQVIPLPKEVQLDRRLAVPAGQLALATVGDLGELGRAAAAELAQWCKDHGGVDPTQNADRATFRVLLGLCDEQGRMAGEAVAGADRLAALPNHEQAYAIAPQGEQGLVLTALREPGLYYAAKTLQQLLTADPEAELPTVTVPLLTVVDWPDLAERGEWGGSADEDVEWLSDMKMNLVETHVNLGLDDAGRGTATMPEELLARGQRHAVKIVPIITHLDQVAGTGVFERYPELEAVGDRERWRAQGLMPMCFSQPRATELLGEWMSALAGYPAVTDVCVWLSEEAGGCQCAQCQGQNQFVLETRAALRGWEQARQVRPDLGLRILLTQASYASNELVLAEVPEGVGVTYYHGGLTYDSSRNPMIYPLLTDYAARGRWLGCYPQLTASWRIVCPWSCPQFVHARMTEFVGKGLKCLCGYATPSNRLYDYNVTAAAEWSWNARGRTEAEFTKAWATRRGGAGTPESAAQWAETMGPVSWDVYGSGIPYPWFFGSAAAAIRDRRLPAWGEGMYRYFPNAEHLAQDLATCDRALALADGHQDLALETGAVKGFLQMLESIRVVGETAGDKTELSAAEREQLAQALRDLDAAQDSTCTNLRRWEDTVGPGKGGSRFDDTLAVVEQTATDVAAALEPLGIEDPGKPYRRHEIGGWASDDFRPGQESIRKQWDVTAALAGTGSYEVRFTYTSGWWGLQISRVALCSASRDAPDTLTEVAADQHDGTAAYENKANTYTLTVDQTDPALRYSVVAEISGVTSDGKPEGRQGCNGAVSMCKARKR